MFSVYGLGVALSDGRIAQEEVLEAASTLLLVHGVGAVLGPLAAGLMMEIYGPGGLLVYFALVLSVMSVFGLWRLRAGTALPVDQQAAYVAVATSSPVVLELDPRTPDRPL